MTTTVYKYRTVDKHILVVVDEQAGRVIDVETIGEPEHFMVDLIHLSVTDASPCITRIGKGKKRTITGWLDRGALLNIAMKVAETSDIPLQVIRRLDNLIEGPRDKTDDALKEVLAVLLGQAEPSRLIVDQMNDWIAYREAAGTMRVEMARA